jgi:ABC-type dipeptide/oligopeptide/nickel transport system ATPase subunit
MSGRGKTRTDRFVSDIKSPREEEIMAQKEQKPQKNNKKAPAKNLKEKRLDKQAKAANKKNS